MKKFVIAIR